jgi:hypothetical protein
VCVVLSGSKARFVLREEPQSRSLVAAPRSERLTFWSSVVLCNGIATGSGIHVLCACFLRGGIRSILDLVVLLIRCAVPFLSAGPVPHSVAGYFLPDFSPRILPAPPSFVLPSDLESPSQFFFLTASFPLVFLVESALFSLGTTQRESAPRE